MEERFSIPMSDGHRVFLRKWTDNHPNPVAVIQLAHGMAEHIGRYQWFAESCLDNGFVVYGNDHRGHGETGQHGDELGFFADANGFERVVEDLNEISGYIHSQYPNKPVFLLGHSLGSFLVRRYVQRFHNQVAGVILTGTAGTPGLAGRVGKMLAKSQVRKVGRRAPSEGMHKLMFGNYNKAFSHPKTAFDWLSQDQNEVQKYIDDPLCGFTCSASFYLDLITGLLTIHQPKEVAKTQKDLPFLVLSGSDDPVGNRTKGVTSAVRQLRKAGVSTIDVKFYEGARHELFQELNREEVLRDIMEWISDRLPSPM